MSPFGKAVCAVVTAAIVYGLVAFARYLFTLSFAGGMAFCVAFGILMIIIAYAVDIRQRR